MCVCACVCMCVCVCAVLVRDALLHRVEHTGAGVRVAVVAAHSARVKGERNDVCL